MHSQRTLSESSWNIGYSTQFKRIFAFVRNYMRIPVCVNAKVIIPSELCTDYEIGVMCSCTHNVKCTLYFESISLHTHFCQLSPISKYMVWNEHWFVFNWFINFSHMHTQKMCWNSKNIDSILFGQFDCLTPATSTFAGVGCIACTWGPAEVRSLINVVLDPWSFFRVFSL